MSTIDYQDVNVLAPTCAACGAGWGECDRSPLPADMLCNACNPCEHWLVWGRCVACGYVLSAGNADPTP